jgi:hypothetical protein
MKKWWAFYQVRSAHPTENTLNFELFRTDFLAAEAGDAVSGSNWGRFVKPETKIRFSEARIHYFPY